MRVSQCTAQAPTFCVTYRDGVPPSVRASVHSSVTMHRMPFFLAMLVTWRGAEAAGFVGAAMVSLSRLPKNADTRPAMAATPSNTQTTPKHR